MIRHIYFQLNTSSPEIDFVVKPERDFVSRVTNKFNIFIVAKLNMLNKYLLVFCVDGFVYAVYIYFTSIRD